MKKRLAVILTAVYIPLAVAPQISADPGPNIGPSGCIESGMAPDRCDMNYINELNGLGVGTWSVLDDGNPQRANAIEFGHHVANNLNTLILRAANQSGSAGAQDVVNAFDVAVQRILSDSAIAGNCAVPGITCAANNMTVEQAAMVAQNAIHWYGPPGM
jgi:hypothetical protein